ncbi:hypothetical protein BDZ90DRAFT_235288, partial [Jaminaea rosea]
MSGRQSQPWSQQPPNGAGGSTSTHNNTWQAGNGAWTSSGPPRQPQQPQQQQQQPQANQFAPNPVQQQRPPQPMYAPQHQQPRDPVATGFPQQGFGASQHERQLSGHQQPVPQQQQQLNNQFAPPPAFAPGTFREWHGHAPPSVLTPTYEQPQFSFPPGMQGQFTSQHPNQMRGGHSQNDGYSGMKGEDDDKGAGGGPGGQKQGTSDFVKKLFTMLDDLSYSSIVSWSHTGDSFVVRNMNDFTKHILPRHFRHSNFASFVRQLNKYDFHKVKNPEEQATQSVDQVWEFKHPDFIRGREDLLENVRRKLPSGKKKGGAGGGGDDRDLSPTMLNPAEAAERGAEEYQQLKDQIATLTAAQDQMSGHISNLTKQYQGVIGEMLTFQRNMVQQDQLMQNLIQYLMNLENDRKVEASSVASGALADGPFVPAQEAQKLIGNYQDVAEATFGQMSQISQRVAQSSNDEATRGNDSYSKGGNGGGHDSYSTPSGQSTVASPTSQASRVSRHSSIRQSMAGNLSPKSMATVPSPATVPSQSALTPAVSERPQGILRNNSDGKSDEMSMFLHPPHLDDDESNTLFNTAANIVDNPSLAGFEGAGLRVFTVGTLQPREGSSADGAGGSSLNAALGRATSEGNGEKQDYGISVPPLEDLPADMPKVDQRTTSTTTTPAPDDDGDEDADGRRRSLTPSDPGSNMLRVRRSTYVPGWAVPPRVLLVDDDAVCRKLSSKFLQVFGCAIDVAVDGVNAVNKMTMSDYDLVLCDIVMPNLDGVTATSLIRQFDPRTPIISMTSNTSPDDLLTYMSSGMNDVLPKPFTKEGLLNMLEKHLIHLKTVQKMDQIPKQLGLPPVSKETLEGVLQATAASAAALGTSGASGSGSGSGAGKGNGNGESSGWPSSSSPGSGKALPAAAMMGNGPNDNPNVVNPLAAMGFSDEEYISMIQSLLAAGTV